MKKLILAAVVTIGAVTASQAGGHFNVGFGLPFGPPPPPRLRAPAVVVSAPVCAPAPVRYVAPVCETPAVVYDTPVCAPAPVYVTPPIRIAPRPPLPYHPDYRYGHGERYGRGFERGHGWRR